MEEILKHLIEPFLLCIFFQDFFQKDAYIINLSVCWQEVEGLGGVQFTVMQLEDLQGGLEVGLWLQQFQLDWPQAVNTGGRQVHPEQGQIHLSHTGISHAREAGGNPPRAPQHGHTQS